MSETATRTYCPAGRGSANWSPGVQLLLSDGRTTQARMVGNDPDADLALLRAESDGLPFAKLGNSKNLKRGQIAIAIGNALGLE